MGRRVLGIVRALGLAIGLGSFRAGASEGAGPEGALGVPEGFQVRVVADETLASDAFAMTLDAKGRMVVTTRGSVRTLHDDDGDGVADRAVTFVETATGGMGLCFDGPDLIFCGDGWLSRYRDRDGDGRADGGPERISRLAFAEHGGHAIRKGPDGCWYVIAGNDAGLGPGHVVGGRSPVTRPVAGGMLRFSPDFKRSEVIADGLRNPYDFDFDALGDLYTYDSDVERDVFLPWYTPTRMFRLATGGHHGWRVTGYLRSWPMPGDEPGTVGVLADVGRGSPTGVVCYRHVQFPARYRGGLFVLDWTFGKVYFVDPAKGSVEVFLEPTGSAGFAPTDVVVAKDGALLISIGGRKTRGSVYRVSFEGGDASEGPSEGIGGVLGARQPLDAWSRARWEPVARGLGEDAFAGAVVDRARPARERVRAVEVVTECFGGLSEETARRAARDGDEGVRARVAWSLGRSGKAWSGAMLEEMAGDPWARVRREAIDGLIGMGKELRPATLAVRLGDGDRGVRASAARLAAGLGDGDWRAVGAIVEKGTVRETLGWTLAKIWREGEGEHLELVEGLCDAIAGTDEPGLRREGVQLLVRAFGGDHLVGPRVEVEAGYTLKVPGAGREKARARARGVLRRVFPSGDARLDEEAGRLLGMLGEDEPKVKEAVAGMWTGESAPGRDLHFLIVMAELGGSLESGVRGKVARAVVAMEGKLGGQEHRVKQSWNERVIEVVGLLVAKDQRLAGELVRVPGFVGAGNEGLALALPKVEREEAARGYLELVRRAPEYAWSGLLVRLLGELPEGEVRGLFRGQWVNRGLRDALLPTLASPAEERDRGIYLDALGSTAPEVAGKAMGALEALPGDREPGHWVALLRYLRRLVGEPKAKGERARVIKLLERDAGWRLGIVEDTNDVAALRRLYAPVFERFVREVPGMAGRLTEGGDELSAWGKRLAKIDWGKGDAGRGLRVFRERGCEGCHAGPRTLGPDLAGVGDRLSREDLLAAIVSPSLDVASAYRTVQVATTDGLTYTGMIAFESADGLLLQTGATTTVRLGTPEIAERQAGERSLMPEGLLKDLDDAGVADLFAYLRKPSGLRR